MALLSHWDGEKTNGWNTETKHVETYLSGTSELAERQMSAQTETKLLVARQVIHPKY